MADRVHYNAVTGDALIPPIAGKAEGAMTVKNQLHQAVDAMSDQQAAALLDTIRRQFSERLADVPLDEEAETDEERAAMEEARADLSAGRLVPWAELKRRY